MAAQSPSLHAAPAVPADAGWRRRALRRSRRAHGARRLYHARSQAGSAGEEFPNGAGPAPPPRRKERKRKEGGSGKAPVCDRAGAPPREPLRSQPGSATPHRRARALERPGYRRVSTGSETVSALTRASYGSEYRVKSTSSETPGVRRRHGRQSEYRVKSTSSETDNAGKRQRSGGLIGTYVEKARLPRSSTLAKQRFLGSPEA